MSISNNCSEEELVANLRKNCFSNGKEKCPKITAKYLHQLGLIFKDKTDPVERKLNLIRSAALLNAAILRNPDDTATILNDLTQLCDNVLAEAGMAHAASGYLLDVSEETKDHLAQIRNSVMHDIGQVLYIGDDVEDEDLIDLENAKVTEIQKIQCEVTKRYKEIMHNISNKVFKLMENVTPLCNFALVGMGSLARNEVTPYSDFESIIVLEEGVQCSDFYENIVENFRWLAVVFQIVIINLGETIIPSVAIPSLNNFHAPNTNGEWFYDAYTPMGVCFDGMMPHASKNPLGRSETLEKPWTTELIKSVSQMANYLNTQEDLKNGYHLADILSKVCYVSGNTAVYNAFEEKVKEILDRRFVNDPDFLKTVQLTIEDDCKKFDIISNMNQVFYKEQLNIKQTMYRSITIFVSALGRLRNIKQPSCLEIIEELSSKHLISHHDAHKLKYAVAVACEIRLKAYLKNKRQCDYTVHFKLRDSAQSSATEYAGLKSTVDALITAYHLQLHVKHFSPTTVTKIICPEYNDGDQLLKLTIMYCLGYYKECIDIAENYKWIPHPTYYQIIHYRLILACSLLRLTRIVPALNELTEIQHFLACDNAIDYSSNASQEKYDAELLPFVIYHRGLCNYELGRYELALDCFKREEKERINENLASLLYQGKCLYKLKQFDSAADQLRKTYSLSVHQPSNNYIYYSDVSASCRFEWARCLLKLHKYDEALEQLLESLAVQKKITQDETTDLEVARMLLFTGRCYYLSGRVNEAVDSLNSALDIVKAVRTSEDTQKLGLKCIRVLGRALFKLGRYKEAVDYLLRESSQQANS